MEHQQHFGKRFYLDRKTGYWISTTCPKVRAHVWVWRNHKGTIPKGHHVHHKNGDKSDNDINNLELMTQHAHLSLHMTPEKKIQASERMHKLVRPKADIWHGSEEGILWHKEHARKMNFGFWDLPEIKCLICKKLFKPKVHHQKFCHNNCKAKYVRRRKKDQKHQKT